MLGLGSDPNCVRVGFESTRPDRSLKKKKTNLLLLYGISDSFFFFVALWFSVESVFSFLLCFGDFEGGFLFEGLLGFFFFWM